MKDSISILLIIIGSALYPYAQEEKNQTLPTYYQDIQPIISKHCINCHSEGNIGPIPLTNYNEVSSYGEMIKFVTSTRYMPPWQADKTYNTFRNQKVLSEKEIKLISEWVEGGLLKGDEKIYSQSTRRDTQTNNNYLDFSMTQNFQQYGVYYDQFQVFPIERHIQEDLYISKIEFIPGNREIVKSVVIAIDSKDQYKSLDEWDPRYGYYHFGGVGFEASQDYWHLWTPFENTWTAPANHLKKIPKNSVVLMYINYGPTAEAQKDSSVLRLYTSNRKQGSQILHSGTLLDSSNITNKPFIIKPDEKKNFHLSKDLQNDISLYSISPQAQLICESIEVYAITPDENTIKLLRINDWDFHWKQKYYFNTPIDLPKGTVIHVLAKYNNSRNNFNNPANPPTKIHWGDTMFSDQIRIHFDYTK